MSIPMKLSEGPSRDAVESFTKGNWFERPCYVKLGCPWDSQIEFSGEVFGTLEEEDVLETSGGLIFAGCDNSKTPHLKRNFTVTKRSYICKIATPKENKLLSQAKNMSKKFM